MKRPLRRPLPEQQSANMVMCDENVSQLESGAQIAEAGEEDGKKRFSNEIEKEVPSLKKKIGLVREKLDDPIIASVHEKPSTVLSFLESNQDSLDDLRKRSETLSEYQVALGLDVDEYETLDEVQLDLTLKLKLWRGVKEWSQLTAGWVVQALLVLTQRLFLRFSELQVRVDGVEAVPRGRDALDVAVRESTRRARAPRQFRDCVIPRRTSTRRKWKSRSICTRRPSSRRRRACPAILWSLD